MLEHAGLYRGHRFPREVIAHAVRRYLRFALSFRARLLTGKSTEP